MITKDVIVIDEDLNKVYSIASDIDKQHEFIPGYKPSKIIGRTEEGALIVERTAEIDGKEMKWQSSAEFIENKAINFKQLEGKLKGMDIIWEFESVDEGTKITIEHDFKLNIPVIGWLAERYIAKPKIDKITRGVLEGLKKYIGE
jgi:ribosome-associated toxin RatA of RatAB toxin-antitoxin module